jgi:hypothetical protein
MHVCVFVSRVCMRMLVHVCVCMCARLMCACVRVCGQRRRWRKPASFRSELDVYTTHPPTHSHSHTPSRTETYTDILLPHTPPHTMAMPLFTLPKKAEEKRV